MKTEFTLALLAAFANARGARRSDLEEFHSFASTFNKHYATKFELEHRVEVWHQNKEKVANLNRDNAGTGVSFAIGETGDLTNEEFRERQGLDIHHPKQKPSEQEIRLQN